jgi:hypothetical protein
MMYGGKTADQMTGDELEAAAVACTHAATQAREVFQMNQAFLVELADEYAKRLQNAKKLN